MRDDAAERAIVGTLLVRPDCIEDLPGALRAEDFAAKGLGPLAELVATRAERGEPTDWPIIQAELGQAAALFGGLVGLGELQDRWTSRAAFVRHVQRVRGLAACRRLVDACGELRDSAREIPDPEAWLEHAGQLLTPLTESRGAAPVRMVAELVAPVVRELQDGKQRGIATGLDDFDRLTTGLGRGNLVVIGGRPSMGKSVLGIELAIGTGVPTIVFQLEMKDTQLVTRMICRAGGVDMSKARHGKLEPHERGDLVRGAGKVERMPIGISDKPGQTIGEIRATARQFVKQHRRTNLAGEPTDALVVIDYLQLVSPAERSGSREQDVSEISRGSKLLARELNVPVLLLAQLSREVEKRPIPRPQLSDLRESGAIEQDADDVVFIWRPERYPQTDKPEHRGKAEIIVAKQRMGPIGAFFVQFDGKFAAIRNEDQQR